MRFPLLFGALAVACAGGSTVIAVPPSDAQVSAWIEQLGAPRFIAREEATRELLDLGPSALPQLQKSIKSPHREIRDRARRIVSILHERQREARLAAFRRGEGELPGWKQFVAHEFGDTEAGRELFAEIVSAEWKLFSTVYDDVDPPRSAGALVTDRIYRVNQKPYSAQSVGTQLGLLLIATDFPDEVSHGQLHGVTHHPSMQMLLSHRGRAPAARREVARNIVGNWLLVASQKGVNQQNYLVTAMKFRLPQGKELARRVLANAAMFPLAKSYAMQMLAMLGDTSSAPIMEGFLTDKSVLQKSGGRERQLRDVALACLMLVHNQDLSLIGVRPGSGNQLFDNSSLGYANEAARERAMKRYRAVKAEGFPSQVEKPVP